jgi:ABC-type transport system substrate-binding protein
VHPKFSAHWKITGFIFVLVACIAIIANLLPSNEAIAASRNLRLAWDAPPRTIDPRYAVDANSQYLEDLTNCALVSFDADGKTVLSLASKAEWTSPAQLVVQLKPNTKFSDGKTVSAADVKATYDFFLNKSLTNPSPRAGAFSGVSKVEVVNPYTEQARRQFFDKPRGWNSASNTRQR